MAQHYRDMLEYIKRFYNPLRRHSKLGDLSLWRSRPEPCKPKQVPTETRSSPDRRTDGPAARYDDTGDAGSGCDDLTVSLPASQGVTSIG